MVLQTMPPPSGARGEKDWTDFDSASFKASVKSRRKKRVSRDPDEQGRNIRPDAPSVTPSWMNKPVASDASWMPIAPPSDDPNHGVDGHVRGDDVKRQEDDSNMTKSPAERRRTARKLMDSQKQKQKKHEAPPNRGRTASLPSPSSQRRGRSNSSRASEREKKSKRQSGENPARNARRRSSSRSREDSSNKSSNETRTPSESPSRRARSTSRQRIPPSDSPQNTVSRGRSSSHPPKTERGRSGSRTPVSQGRSSSRTSSKKSQQRRSHPTFQATEATRPPRAVSGNSNSVGPGLPRPGRQPRTPKNTSDEGSVRTLDTNIGRELTFGTTAPHPPCTPTRLSSRKEGGLMEKLFGDQVDDESKKTFKRGISSLATFSEAGATDLPEQIHPRILLSATVYHNAATNLWITTINTNQRGVATNPSTAAKYLKAFSFSSEKEARESAIANAPPKMLPFSENTNCFACHGKFAVFRRPGHCRNCGVCICNSCTSSRPAKIIPETYNLKQEKTVKICSSCDWLSNAFKKALLKGDYEETIALYGTGNINLRTPFANRKSDKKGETMHPIHCAVEGGNLNIVRWLLEERYCPIKKVTSGNGKKKRGTDVPILTSKGRSVLKIAMSNMKIDILRYLVVEQNVSVHEVKDLTLSLRALEGALVKIPTSRAPLETREIVARWADDEYCEEDGSVDASGSFVLDGSVRLDDSTVESRHTRGDLTDVCIICYDSAIDCVITPCGHQICCLQCGENMKTCPVCNASCQFIRIFKP